MPSSVQCPQVSTVPASVQSPKVTTVPSSVQCPQVTTVPSIVQCPQVTAVPSSVLRCLRNVSREIFIKTRLPQVTLIFPYAIFVGVGSIEILLSHCLNMILLAKTGGKF